MDKMWVYTKPQTSRALMATMCYSGEYAPNSVGARKKIRRCSACTQRKPKSSKGVFGDRELFQVS